MDSGVSNPIFIGFQWSQMIEIADLVVSPGESFRAEFQASRRGGALFALTSAAGIEVVGIEVTLTMTAQQSRLIPPPSAGNDFRWVYTDLVRVNAGGVDEEHLGIDLQIPAVIPVTDPRL